MEDDRAAEAVFAGLTHTVPAPALSRKDQAVLISIGYMYEIVQRVSGKATSISLK